MKILSFVAVLLLLMSCSDTSNKVIGEWKLEEIDYSAYFLEVSDDVKEFLQEKMRSESERIKDKTFFEFLEEGKMKVKAPDFKGETVIADGIWTMNKLQDSLFFELDGAEKYKIITLNDTQLVLSTDQTPKRTLRLSKVK